MNTDIRHCTFTSKKIPWFKFDGTLVAVTRDYYVVSDPFTYEFGVPRCITYPREEWEISEYVKPAKSGCVVNTRFPNKGGNIMSNFMNNEEHIELEEGEILIDNEEYTSNRTNRTELHRMGLNVGGWRKPTHRVQRYDLSRTFCLLHEIRNKEGQHNA